MVVLKLLKKLLILDLNNIILRVYVVVYFVLNLREKLNFFVFFVEDLVIFCWCKWMNLKLLEKNWYIWKYVYFFKIFLFVIKLKLE